MEREERKSLLFDGTRESYRDMESGSQDESSYRNLSPSQKNKLGNRKYFINNLRYLGTFMGVIVTCVLNTFGVVIFERLGWVTAQAGILQALLMYAISYTL